MAASKSAPRKRASSTTAVATARKTAAPLLNGAASQAASSIKAAATVAAAKPKQKLVRDSFTIPKPEYAVLDALKVRAANLMRPTKKSEVLRAGIFALNAMNDRAFLAALNSIPSLKTGRPKNATAQVAARPSSAATSD